MLDGPEGRHAATVSRLGTGEAVVLVDGDGRRGTGIVTAVTGKDVVEVDVADVVTDPRSEPWLVVVQALPKGDRGETAVETMTEVGVDEVVPWSAARCVVRWDASAKGLERWRSTEIGRASCRERV